MHRIRLITARNRENRGRNTFFLPKATDLFFFEITIYHENFSIALKIRISAF